MKNSITTHKQPLNSPDPASAIYYLFPRMKAVPKGFRFHPAKDMYGVMKTAEQGLKVCFQQWYRHWQKCVIAEGT
jgi:hypothetical protein